ncbi:unnamed protein product [Symbiodinium pilosum]|uniref:Uncharacterized protein n=1 Tax=Symbiodinium pilosum TaxID=2952 RepID=A0A812WK81_SYMPI|nr:unnamed protein product [Symbiodinium pilosum]
MGECKCCNDLGSSPKYQLCLTITVGILFVILSLHGIAVAITVNFNLSDAATADMSHPDWEQAEANYSFYESSLVAAYFAGQIVGVLWLVTCISRCCAPCCCELPDVECPCSPCKLFHVIDLCFFVGFFVALWPVNIWYQLNAVPYDDWAAPFKEESFSMFTDVVLVLGLIMLLAAIILGCVKYRQMLKKSAPYTPTVTPPPYNPAAAPQVVGSAVVVQAKVVESNEDV